MITLLFFVKSFRGNWSNENQTIWISESLLIYIQNIIEFAISDEADEKDWIGYCLRVSRSGYAGKRSIAVCNCSRVRLEARNWSVAYVHIHGTGFPGAIFRSKRNLILPTRGHLQHLGQKSLPHRPRVLRDVAARIGVVFSRGAIKFRVHKWTSTLSQLSYRGALF